MTVTAHLPALAAWRRRADTVTLDRLWVAACWEQAAADLLAERPHCLAAAYHEGPWEREQRQRAAGRRASLIPWLLASGPQAIDLTARGRVVDLLKRAREALPAPAEPVPTHGLPGTWSGVRSVRRMAGGWAGFR